MSQSVTLDIPASGAKVNVLHPNGSFSFDIPPAPGGTITISVAPYEPAPMVFSSLSLPYVPPEQRPRMKLTLPNPPPEVTPRVSSYVPLRDPSPEPNVHLVPPPPIPQDLSHCGLVMYGYRLTPHQCSSLGFLDLDDAADKISASIDKLRISAFSKAADIPESHELEIFYFALCRKGAPVFTEDERGVPEEKMRELEGMMGLERARWVSFDDVFQWDSDSD